MEISNNKNFTISLDFIKSLLRNFKYYVKSKNPFQAEINDAIKVSFSQSGEDLIIKYIFDALNIEKPTYLDIGAHHPEHLNNTKIFYDSDSNGVNIEANPHLIDAFHKERKRDTNLNCGIGIENKSLDFYILSESTLSTFSKAEAEKSCQEGGYQITEIIKIPVISIQEVFRKYFFNSAPDLLSIDVEGWDYEILSSIDFDNTRPTIICIESISFSANGNGLKDERINSLLSKKGYIFYADTNINSIFVLEKLWKK